MTPPDSGGPEAGPGLEPKGEDVAWSALGTLLSGPIVWGGVGLLIDIWLGTGRIFTAAGVVLGALTAFYIVYVRFGRDQ
ncbi:MAG: AtpZ/AtpI family protein [Candidatus Nanopelagicales bacterium]